MAKRISKQDIDEFISALDMEKFLGEYSQQSYDGLCSLYSVSYRFIKKAEKQLQLSRDENILSKLRKKAADARRKREISEFVSIYREDFERMYPVCSEEYVTDYFGISSSLYHDLGEALGLQKDTHEIRRKAGIKIREQAPAATAKRRQTLARKGTTTPTETEQRPRQPRAKQSIPEWLDNIFESNKQNKTRDEMYEDFVSLPDVQLSEMYGLNFTEIGYVRRKLGAVPRDPELTKKGLLSPLADYVATKRDAPVTLTLATDAEVRLMFSPTPSEPISVDDLIKELESLREEVQTIDSRAQRVLDALYLLKAKH